MESVHYLFDMKAILNDPVLIQILPAFLLATGITAYFIRIICATDGDVVRETQRPTVYMSSLSETLACHSKQSEDVDEVVLHADSSNPKIFRKPSILSLDKLYHKPANIRLTTVAAKEGPIIRFGGCVAEPVIFFNHEESSDDCYLSETDAAHISPIILNSETRDYMIPVSSNNVDEVVLHADSSNPKIFRKPSIFALDKLYHKPANIRLTTVAAKEGPIIRFGGCVAEPVIFFDHEETDASLISPIIFDSETRDYMIPVSSPAGTATIAVTLSCDGKVGDSRSEMEMKPFHKTHEFKDRPNDNRINDSQPLEASTLMPHETASDPNSVLTVVGSTEEITDMHYVDSLQSIDYKLEIQSESVLLEPVHFFEIDKKSEIDSGLQADGSISWHLSPVDTDPESKRLDASCDEELMDMSADLSMESSEYWKHSSDAESHRALSFASSSSEATLNVTGSTPSTKSPAKAEPFDLDAFVGQLLSPGFKVIKHRNNVSKERSLFLTTSGHLKWDATVSSLLRRVSFSSSAADLAIRDLVIAEVGPSDGDSDEGKAGQVKTMVSLVFPRKLVRFSAVTPQQAVYLASGLRALAARLASAQPPPYDLVDILAKRNSIPMVSSDKAHKKVGSPGGIPSPGIRSLGGTPGGTPSQSPSSSPASSPSPGSSRASALSSFRFSSFKLSSPQKPLSATATRNSKSSPAATLATATATTTPADERKSYSIQQERSTQPPVPSEQGAVAANEDTGSAPACSAIDRMKNNNSSATVEEAREYGDDDVERSMSMDSIYSQTSDECFTGSTGAIAKQPQSQKEASSYYDAWLPSLTKAAPAALPIAASCQKADQRFENSQSEVRTVSSDRVVHTKVNSPPSGPPSGPPNGSPSSPPSSPTQATNGRYGGSVTGSEDLHQDGGASRRFVSSVQDKLMAVGTADGAVFEGKYCDWTTTQVLMEVNTAMRVGDVVGITNAISAADKGLGLSSWFVEALLDRRQQQHLRRSQFDPTIEAGCALEPAVANSANVPSLQPSTKLSPSFPLTPPSPSSPSFASSSSLLSPSIAEEAHAPASSGPAARADTAVGPSPALQSTATSVDPVQQLPVSAPYNDRYSKDGLAPLEPTDSRNTAGAVVLHALFVSLTTAEQQQQQQQQQQDVILSPERLLSLQLESLDKLSPVISSPNQET